MALDDLEGNLRNSVRELAESIAEFKGESMFDSSKQIEERVFALEMVVTEMANQQAQFVELLATLTLKFAENMEIGSS